MIPIIGAGADLQARMLEDLKSQRQKTAGTRVANSKIEGFEENQRQNARYEISKSAICFPILASREIAASESTVGIAVNIGVNGMKLMVDSMRPFNGMEVLVGIECRAGEYQFVSGVVVSTRKSSESAFEAGVEFRGYMHEVLECEQIMPMLDTDGMRFELPYPEPMLASLCKVGAAVSLPMDAVTLCPNCHGLPTFRYGCSLCLSNNVKASKMIHHFACANVDFVENFELENELCCQKCRTRRMIIGSDYEYLDGPNMCYDCGQANLEKIQIGHCLSCEHRFPVETAYQMDIVGYRVKRLDVLHFIGTA